MLGIARITRRNSVDATPPKKVVSAVIFLCFTCITRLASEPATPELKFTVQIVNKERTACLSHVRAGDSVVLRILPQRMNGRAFVSTIDSVTVELSSGFPLLVHGNPTSVIDYPFTMTGPVNRYVFFTKIPVYGIETVKVTGISQEPLTGALTSLSGKVSLLVSPGAPEKVVFFNPGSQTQGLTPTSIIPGIAYACTVVVYDRFGNKTRDPVRIVARSLMPDIASIIGGSPDLTITSDSTGVAAFYVKLTEKAKTNDLVRLEAEIVGESYEDSGHMAKEIKTFLNWRCDRCYAPYIPQRSHRTSGTSRNATVDVQGRIARPVSSMVRIMPHARTMVYLGKKKRPQ
jgi:hypothetical protein